MKEKAGKFVVQMGLILFAVIQLYPLVWLVFFSLKGNGEIFGGNIAGLPEHWKFGNYINAFKQAKVLDYFGNSVWVTFITILLVIVLSAMSAYAIVRMEWRGSQVAMKVILLGMMVPIHAALLPLFMVLKKAHLLNTYWALIIPYVAFGLPMGIYIISSFLDSIPRELEEAAAIDGCGIYRIFINIMLPLIKPALATVSIFTYLSAWNELMFAVTFVSKREFKTITVGIMSMIGTYTTKWGEIGAGLVIATIPTVLIYMLLSEQVQKSLVAGAVKG
ncbi:carbohydrate ABC transporter permease [Cellulosilyticum lentocellum]|uniref:ABC-type transporter, integral membrane subunit n=1 Tax=Cellulosilyticum lentocellum (strain ATCC 49066 / DSM 5427 / NCIMB 11756 / RHM5) TaxID=642492 RepID=F2JIC4_CELLD|nr:carbohydrate ABC transporter permease [Cellulosilyticum lentocellum]ADZ84290.1 ABC-type transporter, integral membrane subunit [Cellulosilyticum lentocellum DSM 5427]